MLGRHQPHLVAALAESEPANAAGPRERANAAVDPGAHAVVMLDQAGRHRSTGLAVPQNVTLLPLPPRSPELNPLETLWQSMRDNRLSNRVFEGHHDIVAHCCGAWSRLLAQPARITSIGLRARAHGV